MEQHIPQEEIRRIIISDMVKKRNSIVPVIGEDTIVYRDKETGKEILFQEFVLNEPQKKYPRVVVDDVALTSMNERVCYGLSLLSQYYNEQGRFLDDFMDFVSKNPEEINCVKDLYQHKLIDGECFANSIDKHLSIPSNSTMNNQLKINNCALYKVNANKISRFFIDDEEVEVLEPSKITKVPLRKGQYFRKVKNFEDVKNEEEIDITCK